MINYAKTLEGYRLNGRDGTVGTLKDLYFDDATWTVRYLVVTVGGLLKRRHVLLSPHSVVQQLPSENQIDLDVSSAQIKSAPDADMDKPVSRQHEEEIHRYYGWTPYWVGLGFAAAETPVVDPIGSTAYPGQESTTGRRSAWGEGNAGDPHLRSMNEVRGYSIEAIDGDIGHLEDFLVEDRTWKIPYVVVDTRNWLPGRKVAVPIPAFRGISWADHRVSSSLSKEQIEASPVLENTRSLSLDIEQKLRTHYRAMPVRSGEIRRE